MKHCLIFREDEPPNMVPFARGAFLRGFLPECHSAIDFTEDKYKEIDVDVAVVCGGLSRYECQNQRITNFYRSKGKPVIICEFGRLFAGTQLLLLNRKPWVPPGLLPDDRARKLGFEFEPKPRGEDILFCGQRADLDAQMEKFTEELKRATGRRVIYRPHPNMWRLIDRDGNRPNYTMPCADEVSNRNIKLNDETTRDLHSDFDRAWCVVTHSSIVTIQAALRGLPSYATPEAAGFEICCTLGKHGYEPKLPPQQDIWNFLARFSYTVWYEHEIARGYAIEFMVRHF